MMSEPVLPISGSQLLINRSGRAVLDVASLALGNSPSTAIVGPNGAGKSLLIRTLTGLLAPDFGAVTWAGSKPDALRRLQVGLLLQRPVLLGRSALQNVAYALRVAGVSRKDARLRAHETLNQAGLGALVDTFAHQLSGGEQQRLALARALALKPDMLFLDEATANVDPASTLAIEQQLREAMSCGLVVVFVSHDVGQVKRLANDVVLMHKGKIVEHSATEHFFNKTNNVVTQRWLAGEILV